MQNVNESKSQSKRNHNVKPNKLTPEEKSLLKALETVELITNNISFIYSMIFVTISSKSQNMLERKEVDSLDYINTYAYNKVVKSSQYSQFAEELTNNISGALKSQDPSGSKSLIIFFAQAIKKLYLNNNNEELKALLCTEDHLTDFLRANLLKLQAASNFRLAYQTHENAKKETVNDPGKLAVLLSNSMDNFLSRVRGRVYDNNSSMDTLLSNRRHPPVDRFLMEEEEIPFVETIELPKKAKTDNITVQEEQQTSGPSVVLGQN